MTDFLRDRESLVRAARARIAEKRSRVLETEAAPAAERGFDEKYAYLVNGLRAIFAAIGEPGLEVAGFGSRGLRLAFRLTDPEGGAPIVDREIRLSPLDATGEVHLVFSAFQTAERHASFPLTRPDLPRLEAAFLDFLVEGVEPRWIRRPPAPRREAAAERPEPGSEATLELPLEETAPAPATPRGDAGGRRGAREGGTEEGT